MDIYEAPDTILDTCWCGPVDEVVAAPEPVFEPVDTEPTYAQPTYAEPVYAEPVVAEPVYAEPVYAEPVYAEPVYAEPVYAEPVYAEPVYAAPADTGPPAAPVELGVVGGTDPYAGAPTRDLGVIGVIGGTNPYGMTIDAGGGAGPLPTQAVAVIGGPTPHTAAALDVSRYTDNLDVILGAAVRPAAGQPGAIDQQVVDDISRSTLVLGMLPALTDAELGLADTASALYHGGDDIDPDSRFYRP